jgi:hypothetical protein
VLHRDEPRLDELIDDWKALFPTVLDIAATKRPRPQAARRATKGDTR